MALTQNSRVVLNDGHKMPVVGFGTYAPETYTKEQGYDSTKVAIEVGYRHIDGAFIYGNEVEVGKAIREKIADGTVKRGDIFYTGKLWGNNHTPDRVRPALENTLKDLQLDYIDLFIIHTPMDLKVECHIYLNQSKLLEFCKDNDIVLVGYSVLGSSRAEGW
ncbi:prostaglandin-E(2) 9-reductase-like [Pseudophryne corroboree]|uniref:prostaglandin-E(2) 9-reductase-like n=1 Tax=Pseudophryne corroboree TaxID=495146 RepID=UPI0030812D6B